MKTSKKYNWQELQAAYDAGLSQNGLHEKYGVSTRTIHTAVKNGDLVCRNRSDAVNLHNSTSAPTRHTDEFKERQRANIIARYENGWAPKAGRCTKFKHISIVAGEVSLDGTWELAVAKWLDDNNYHWKRNTKRFSYINLKGKISHYTQTFGLKKLIV